VRVTDAPHAAGPARITGSALRLFRTRDGWVVESRHGYSRVPGGAAALTSREDLHAHLLSFADARTHAAPPQGILAPVEAQEVWAAGVTYFRSRTARMEESKVAAGGSFYDLVYSADRPELFFKAAAWRVIGPDGAVRIRRDAHWNVPEPEVALLISPGGRILGYTAGNDVSSRDIEGENPLYLPQAKVYDGSCALGPGILVLPDGELLPPETGIALEIRRGGSVHFAGSTTLAAMKRDFRTLVEFLYRETSFPDGCVLLTGTGIVPPDNFTLQAGDETLVSVDGVGVLRNTVAGR
jgi:2-dehydro-3-deoxy-D-arabinonate dehydratase